MRLLNFILIIFLILTNGIKADTETQIIKNLKNGGNLIFIRHAYAPGGGDPDNFDLKKAHLIPGVIHRMHVLNDSGDGRITIWGDGSARREFMYASDLADFVCFALSNYKSVPEEINVGLGFDFTVKEYYEMIAEEIGYEGDFEFDLSRPTGMKQKLVDTTKQEEMGWKPSTETKEGIRKTYRFFIDGWV